MDTHSLPVVPPAVGLGLAEGLDLLLHGGNLLLCFGEGAIVAAAQLGVELK